MSELSKATLEQLEAFQLAVRENPGLIGQVVSRAIENGTLVVDGSGEAVSVDQLLAQLEAK